MTYHDPRLMRTHGNIDHLRNVAMHYLVDEDLFDRQLRKQQNAIERIQEDNRHLYGNTNRTRMDELREDRESIRL